MNREEKIKNWDLVKAHDPDFAKAARYIIRAMDCDSILFIQGSDKPRPPAKLVYNAPFER